MKYLLSLVLLAFPAAASAQCVGGNCGGFSYGYSYGYYAPSYSYAAPSYSYGSSGGYGCAGGYGGYVPSYGYSYGYSYPAYGRGLSVSVGGGEGIRVQSGTWHCGPNGCSFY